MDHRDVHEGWDERTARIRAELKTVSAYEINDVFDMNISHAKEVADVLSAIHIRDDGLIEGLDKEPGWMLYDLRFYLHDAELAAEELYNRCRETETAAAV